MLMAVFLLLLCVTAASALTTPQLLQLRDDIAADPAFATVPHNADGAYQVAAAYNLPAQPDFWVWKTSVSPDAYTGLNSIVWTEVDQLSVGKARIFEWMTGGLTRPINAADPNVQKGIADAFGAQSVTRTNLATIAKRQATRAEKLYATGPGDGSQATPATLTFEGALGIADIMAAWYLP